MQWLRKKCPRADPKIRKENGLNEPYVRVVDFESVPHKAVSFVVRREKEMKEWSCRRCCLVTVEVAKKKHQRSR